METNLTRAQFTMWLGQQLDPDVPLYNMVQTFRIGGELDTDAMQRAWHDVVGAADALRTVIETVGDVPQQRVLDSVDGGLEIVDLRGADDPERAAQRWIEQRCGQVLDLRRRCWDTALLRLEGVGIWYLCMHHVISDAQSFALVHRATGDRYSQIVTGTADHEVVLPRYADFVAFERESRDGAGAERSARHWREMSAEDAAPLDFYGATVSGDSSRTDRVPLDVGTERSGRIRELARDRRFAAFGNELSIGVLWSTVLATTLHRISGRDRIRMGTPFLGRPRPPDRETIGLFVEVGVIEVDLGDLDDGEGATFVDVAGRLRASTIDGIRHATPGASAAEVNRSYDVLVNHVGSRFGAFGGHPVTTDWVHSGHGDRNHALRLQTTDFGESGSFRLFFDLNTQVFSGDRGRRLVQHFERVLDHLLADPAARIGDIELLDDDEHRRLVVDFNDTDTAYPADSTVVDLFRRQVEISPDEVAVVDAHEQLTYRELDERAGVVAAELRRRDIGRGDLVGICARRSARTIAGILGVLKAGAAYVPIDPDYPAERREFMLADADPAVVITSGLAGDELDGLGSARLDLDAVPGRPVTDEPGTGRSDRVEHDTATADDLAYVIYTSGSTGRPKGTELTHRGLTNYLCWAREVYQEDGPRDFALYSSLAFDLTITSLFVPLVSGGRVVVYDRSERGKGLEILDVFADDRVDVVKLTPAHLALLRETTIRCERIRHLILGGENLRTDLASAASAHFPAGVAIDNEYGPTETVVGCMIHRFDPATDVGPSVPIGRPAANARVYVLDRYDRPVPPGVVGEMVISSDGVARGYRNRPELTAERFDDDPLRPGARRYRTGDLARWTDDGRMEFLGRDDGQVKIRGARIELGEVEAALLEDPDVGAATVGVVDLEDLTARRHCAVCGLPSNVPGADLDDTDTCADCRTYAAHEADVGRYFESPEALARVLDAMGAAHATDPYDCLVLVSGGKDSTYMLYQLVRRYGVRPLVFTLDNGFISASALDNVRLACDDLGVDLHIGSTPHMNAIFADSLDRHANVCDGCYKTIYTLSMGLARRHGIDTIITGLSRGQLFETRLADTFAAREFDPERIDRMIIEARTAYHRADDAVARLLEPDLFSDDSIFDEIRFVDFYRYVDVGLDEVYRYLGTDTVWQRPPDTGRSTNCLINDVGIYVHQHQRGFHNYALPYSWDVRMGHKTREAAMDELDDELDLDRVRTILSEIGRSDLVDQLRADRRLVGYYVGTGDAAPADVRRRLAERLPDFLVPTYLVRLPELPLTPNGKIDRTALPDPRTVTQSSARYVAPVTELERTLVDAWRSVLRIETIGVEDNFFDIGGDSIASIQIVAAARRAGLHITARDLFAHQTIGALAAAIDAVEPPPEPASVRGSGDGHASPDTEASPTGYPLTPTQLGMVFHSLGGSAGTYFGQGTCELEGEVDPALFRRAWEIMTERHAALRTRFVWAGRDTPVQVTDTDLAWTDVDWRERSSTECTDDLEALLHRERTTGFDLERGPLTAFTLVRCADRHHFVWSSHHAVLDGWSAHVVFAEALDVYEQLVAGGSPSLPTVRPFRDHVLELLGRDRATATAWWSRYLDGVSTTTAIPFDTGRTDAPERPERSRTIRSLSIEDTVAVDRFNRARRITASTLATAAWSLVLGRLTRSDDVLFGTTVSGREGGVEDAEHLVGMLIATLPTRIRLDADADVGPWLAAIQSDALAVRDHGHLGLVELQGLTTIPTRSPIFDSIVVVENYPSADTARSSLRPSALLIDAPSNFPLAVLVHPGERLTLELVHDPARIDDVAAARLLDHLEQTIRSLVDPATVSLADVEIVTAHDRDRLLALAKGPEPVAPARPVPEVIAEHARTHPDLVAVVGDDLGELTYAELEHRVAAVARSLSDRGVASGDHVGVDVTAGGAAPVVAMLAVFRAGGVYVPIDAELPDQRLRSIVERTGMRVIVSGASPPAALGDLTVVSPTDPSHADRDRDAAPGSTDPSQAAYVIFTSGSTGEPKGVVVSHANLAASTAARFDVYPDRVGTFLLLSSMTFDSSMVGLFWTLCSGGTLVVTTPDHRTSLPRIAGSIRDRRVTHLLALPSLYAALLAESGDDQLDSLTTVIVAGEACPEHLPADHARRCPTARLYNEYGPSEGTVWSHVALLTPDVHGTPIGRPIPGTTGVVLDRFDHAVPEDVPGELVIGGAGIAAGYLGRPDLTDAAFTSLPARVGPAGVDRWYRTGDLVRWRADGALDFVGRVDEQVKVLGHRIELTEVELALTRLPEVSAAAAVVVPSGNGSARDRLVGCYVAGEPIDEARWRAELGAHLPRYMLPTAFVRVDSMPLTSTGKIDRRVLQGVVDAAAVDDAPPTAPVDDLEAELLAIWTDVLGRPGIGTRDDFFDLGGNSLDAMRVFARVRRLTGRDLLLSTLFDAPTVAAFAELLRRPIDLPADTSLVPIAPSGSKRPFFYVAPYEVSVLELGKIGKYFDPERPMYGLQPSGLLPDEEVHETIEAMAAHYIEAIRRHQPVGPYFVGGHCDGAWVAHEIAVQLSDLGERVGYLGLVDVPPPGASIPTTHRARRVVDRLRYYRQSGRLIPAIRWQLKLRLEKQLLLRFGSAADRRVRHVRLAHEGAFGRYEFRHDHRSPIHLVRSAEMADLMEQIDWYAELAAGPQDVTTTDVDTTHARLLMDPDTRDVARALSDGMDRADAQLG